MVFLFENLVSESRKSTCFEVIYSFTQQTLADYEPCAKHGASLHVQQRRQRI